MLESGFILGGRYEIREKIGQGGMSVVYSAIDKRLDRTVAVKVLNEEYADNAAFVRSFLNEAKAAAHLVHPNIVSVYDCSEEGELHYIVMELVEGITLKNYIEHEKVFTNRAVIGTALQIANGLAEAHARGIVHRDIKPQNIIVSRDGKLKIADFGIAGAENDQGGDRSILGSAFYMAPERAEKNTADARSDLYSLGITMYEMITGRLPYEGENAAEVLQAHASEALVPPSVYNKEIYPALNDIILKATRKKPDERYQTAKDMIEDLERAAREPNGHFVRMYNSQGSSRLNRAERDIREIGQKLKDEIHIRRGNEEDGGENGFIAFLKERKILAVCLLCTLLLLAALGGSLAGHIRRRNVRETEAATTADAAETSQAETDYSIQIREETIMPSLLGISLDSAQTVLSGLRVSLDGSESDYSDVYMEGVIMSQDPAVGDMISPDTVVHVVVSRGSRLDYAVKNIRGLSEEDARVMLEEAGLEVLPEKKQVFSDDVAEGMVAGCSVWHEEGTEEQKLAEGSRVILNISAGRESEGLVMPDFTGHSRAEAETMLSASGLISSGFVSEERPDLPEGQVISQSVAPGTLVKRGSMVTMVVASGGPGYVSSGSVYGVSSSQLDKRYYYGSIDDSCVIGEAAGPSDAFTAVNVMVRMVQTVNGGLEYVVIEEPRPIARGARIPLIYRNIRGVQGVTSGEIQVLNADTGEIYHSVIIPFHPVG